MLRITGLLLALAAALGAGEIRGTVTDPAGLPVPGAQFSVRLVDTERVRSFQADPQGGFRLTGLSTGVAYLVACSAPGRVSAYQMLYLERGQDFQRRDVRLQSAAGFNAPHPGMALAGPEALDDLAGAEAHDAGLAQFNAGRFQAALPWLEAAAGHFTAAQGLAQDPEARKRAATRLASAERLLGCALAELAQPSAEPLLRRSLQRDPGDTAVHQLLARTLKAGGDLEGLALLKLTP